jgi:hypothetical protein
LQQLERLYSLALVVPSLFFLFGFVSFSFVGGRVRINFLLSGGEVLDDLQSQAYAGGLSRDALAICNTFASPLQRASGAQTHLLTSSSLSSLFPVFFATSLGLRTKDRA